MTSQRISKFLAGCGVASRRKSEAFVASGRVKVNGDVVTDLGHKVGPGDSVLLDDVALSQTSEYVYIMLNKPRGYLTTASDDRGRKTVMSLIEPGQHRVFPVGRLDLDTEGLLLLTDDGDLAFSLTHPGRNIEKRYRASLTEPLTDEGMDSLRKGIMLDGTLTYPAKVRKLHGSGLIIEVVIHEGRKRQVRRMVEAAGSRVLSLKRTQLGPLELGSLKPGTWRHLTSGELNKLKGLSSRGLEEGA